MFHINSMNIGPGPKLFKLDRLLHGSFAIGFGGAGWEESEGAVFMGK
jgi:hypothetical protein